MNQSPGSKQFRTQRLRRLAGLFLLVLFANFTFIPEAEAACPNPAFPALGNIVELVSCTEAKAGADTDNIDVPVPAGVAAGNLLIAIVAIGDDETVDTPGGWTAVAMQTIGNNRGMLGVFARISPGGEPASYNFSWQPDEQAYAYMLRFTDASGQGVVSSDGDRRDPTTSPSVDTLVPDTLILRMAGWDRDRVDVDPGTIVAGHTNITQDRSGNGGGSVSGAAAYVNQPVVGASGTADFEAEREWGAVTLGIDPIEFRLSMPDTTVSTCGIQDVTLSVTDRNGTAMTWFTGTVTLRASNGAGAAWANAGGLNGVLNDLGDGEATYQFSAADNGVATFAFTNPNIGVTNFDVDYRVFTSIENGAFDPDLNVTPCSAEILAQACVAGKSTSITIDGQEAVVTDRGRMVLMAISFEGTADVTSATFDVGGLNASMTRIYREANLNGAGNITELWGILDANLPTGGGTYSGNFTTPDTDPSICLLYLDSADQAFPQPDLGTPANGAVNGSQAQNQQDAITTITTTADNALVLSLVGNGSGGADYSSVSPSPPMFRLFDAPDPGGGAEFEGSSGILAAAGPITVTETWGGGNPNRHSHVVASFPPLPFVPTEIRLSHDGESDVCSVEAITISVTNSAGFPATSFAGTITISNSAGAGSWTVNDATNPLVDLGGGSVEYTFDPADNGQIVLDYQLTSSNAAVDFGVTTTTPGISSPSGSFDPTLEIVTCSAEVDVNPTTNVCSVSETVTLTVRDRDGGVPSGTIGTIVLNTSTGNGDFLSTTGAGTLNNGALDDGVATYAFDSGDGGTVDIEFYSDTPETLNLSASSTHIPFDAGASNESLEIFGCEFRISHSGATDVCSVETVTISVFNTDGGTVTDYVGTVNLSTSTGNGTWQNDSGNGTVTDPVAEDGNATYEFVAGDNGTVDLFFTDATLETVNINVGDGTTTASNPSFDPNLTVANCSFRITMVDQTMTACESEAITITVYDSNSAVAMDFTGTVNLSTDTLNGSWADAGGLNGSLTDATSGDGAAAYTFDAADNGVATFTFTDDNAEDVNINLVSGTIVENGSFDPTLEVTGCIPSLVNSVCFPGSGPGTGNLTIGGADPGRMVAMIIWHIDGTPQDVTNATFNGANMTEIERVSGGNTTIEMWGILDANLPATGGAYAGNYSFDAAPANDPSMCMVELANVEQAFPQPNGSNPNQGEVNSNTFTPDGAPNDMTTSITTSGNNAFILTAGLSDYAPGGNSWFNAVAPTPPMEQFFWATNDQNPEGGTAGGSIGVQPSAGLITVTDTDTQDAVSSAAHIVASFNPLVAGLPQVEGYVPVLLFDTYSGNLAYKAIGNTLRTASNDSGGACSFVPVGTGSDATLAMPGTLGSDTEVLAAYLYWAGSGEEFEADDTVEFGPSGSEISITADEMFQIEGVGGGALDFFAGYKDVTSQITVNNGTYTLRNLTVQDNPPWSDTQACAGGWALIVVYTNPNERFRVANLFHGFQPFQNSSFTLVPRNFRMATADGAYLPNGEVTHVTIEGDETLANGDESLGIQDAPGAETFTTLSNSFNPPNAEFNSTVTRPIFSNTFGTGFYEFDGTAGLNGDGYEIDQPGPDALEAGRTGYEIGASWGFDVETHYLAGANPGDPFYPFAQPGQEAEQITTRYSAGQDLVMLISEVITVTNYDLADLEINKSQSGDFKVNGAGTYTLTVVNNGNGGITGGEATGQVLVTDQLPNGLTLGSVSGTGWDCSLTTVSAFTCAIDIATDCGAAEGCATTTGQLEGGESLAPITVNVNVGDTTFFPNLSNNVKNVTRMQHNGGSCGALVAGVIPDPDTCDRSPQFDNVNDLQGGAIDINDLEDKTSSNNNVDSIITDVRGIETNLAIDKSVVGILEVGETATYSLQVTNLGPDATTGGAGGTITVSDPQPTGVTFDSASGPGWSCTLGPLNCSYTGTLGIGASTTITLDVTVTGAAGQNVTNTASVTPGTFNFDSNTGNNSDTDITQIVAPPVASNERFLLSVSVPGNSTQIGGLAAFENDDAIIYDPLTDVGTLYYDDSGEGYDVRDADAIHLFKNGHVAFSAAGPATSSIGSNSLNFEPEDIVVWDPILETATMLFDGSVIFDGPIGSDENIDAVYVRDDGVILLSTAGPASITFAGPTTVSFNQGDIVAYDPSDGSASILIDASDPDIFGGEVQVDALYQRVDDSNPDLTREVYILSVNEASSIIGACAGCDPVGGTTTTRDDVVSIDLTGAAPATENLFLGDQPLGVFTPASSDRTIDALHVVEDGYLGHFAISQSQAGSTCEAGQITIRKHKGLSHTTDTDYEGSILITTDIGEGDWAVAVGGGSLDNGTAGDGAARYTFVPGDNGQVTLYLTQDTPSTINVNVTNTFTRELASEDPNFNFNDVLTSVTYRDEWSAVSFGNNDGTTFWAADWVELDGVASGPAAGNISVDSGRLRMTSTTGDPTPSLSRVADLSAFTVTETVFLNFDYAYEFLNSGSDVLVVEARPDSGSSFTTVQTFSGIGGTNLTLQPVSLNLTSLLGSPAWTDTTEIRFRITGGYTGTSRMFFDNIELATGTTDCGIGSISHYEIRIDGNTGFSSDIFPGIQCVGTVVTITGHDGNHFTAASNETISLQTGTGKGDWTLLAGAGAFNNGSLGDGIATYTFVPGEFAATFLFNYTDPASDPEVVNFNIGTTYGVALAEDPSLAVSEAGLLFYNEIAGGPTSLNPIGTQIAGKASNVAAPSIDLITIEGVRTSDNDPQACAPLFDIGNTLSIGFAAECQDPSTCSAGVNFTLASAGDSAAFTPAPDNAGPGTSSSYTPVDVLMEDQGGGRVGGTLAFTYPDAGQIEMHAEYEIPLGDDLGGQLSGDTLVGSSSPFVVRPFAFNVDFGGDGDTRGTVGLADDSYAADADGSTFVEAGASFDTTVTAVQYAAADDLNGDGVPDTEAQLWDNAITPNFGNESVSYKVRLNSTTVAPSGGLGSISNNEFTSFSLGAQTHGMNFDEVGIIDLDAVLLDLSNNPVSYLGGGQTVIGHARDVGRFYPATLELVPAGEPITSRVVAGMQSMCIADPMSLPGGERFTYLGEAFGVNFDLEARNINGAVTENYVDDFAKLTTIDHLTAAAFRAFEIQAGPDNDLSARLALAASPPSVMWPDSAAVTGRGIGSVAGDLILERAAVDAGEGPYVGLTIGLNTADADGVPLALSIDIDDTPPDDAEPIGTENFRYGWLLIENSYGPETESVPIFLRAEYYDGSEFVTNTLDSCTVLFYDGSEATATDRSLFFVTGTYTDNLDPGETVIEQLSVGLGNDVTRSLFEGRMGLRSETNVDGDDSQDDGPFFASAPGELQNGSVIVEFDLDDPDLPYSLEFLSFDWRDAVETEDIGSDGVADNPRGQLEFGSFRGHDLIINWQEIYIAPN